MSDIARALGMSKKTLYVHVENKADLIKKSVQRVLNQEREVIEQLHAASRDAIDEILKISRFMQQQMQKMTPSMLYDLRKYHRESGELVRAHIQDYAKQNVLENLLRGQREGLYRKDFTPEFIAELYVSKFDLLSSKPNRYPSGMLMPDFSRELLSYHIHGVASEKGLQQLQKYLAQCDF